MSHAADHFRSTHQEDGSVVLDLARGTITTLNPTGGFIWQALQDGMTEEDIVARLVEIYPKDRAQIEDDVRTFLSALADHHLTQAPGA